ncbi:hypothetical protein ACVRWB_06050 [Streptococcus troglodytae]|uniref:Conserved domain protein n=1 Tax=Streptococcus troglodytae TaxID=1111760 RepID=A0A1L7LGN3_9STRE|nr:hypothetical protein [Streptococcus troglodytae]BAQ23357.1 conserved domain protein [Streptococcus troglodytae]
MKKKIIIISFVLIAISGIAAFKLTQSGSVKIGTADGNYKSLPLGTYTVGDDIKLKDGKYAVYALEGSGSVTIGGKKYHISDRSYKKAKKKGLPENARYGILYEDSPKIIVKKGSKVIVEGKRNFRISFVRR